MTDIIATVTTAIGLTKQLFDIADATKSAEAKLLVADLRVQLAELKDQLAELMEENRQLKEELKKSQSTVAEVVFKSGLYYRPDGDGPFCTTCYDKEHKLIRVTRMARQFWQFGKWSCGVCETHYQ
jgi:hypothetical protein